MPLLCLKLSLKLANLVVEVVIPDVCDVIGSLAFSTKEYYDFYSQFLHSEIAALITSYARVHLYELMEKAGLEHIYYCDTDSIFTDIAMQTNNELGGIKNEAVIDDFIAVCHCEL